MNGGEVLSALVAAASGLAGAGVGYGLTLGRIRTVERDVERLERTSASKEAHEGLRNAVDGLRAELDRRFDRLERLILSRQSGSTNPGD